MISQVQIIPVLKLKNPVDGINFKIENNILFQINSDNTVNKYAFNGICDENVDQTHLYDTYYKDWLKKALTGANALTFCYGGSGSGKVIHFSCFETV